MDRVCFHRFSESNSKAIAVFNQYIRAQMIISIMCSFLLVSACAEESLDYFRNFWPSGNPRSIEPLVHGQRHGLAEYYHDNGQLYGKISWVNGQKHGQFKLYRDNGSLEEELSYHNGKEHGWFKWHGTSGNVEIDMYYVNGQAHGPRNDYYANGNLKAHLNFVDDQMHGVNRWYYENGNIDTESTYANGVLHGKTFWFYEDGTEESQATYENDVLIAGEEPARFYETDEETISQGMIFAFMIPFLAFPFIVILCAFVIKFFKDLTAKRVYSKDQWSPEIELQGFKPRYVIRRWLLWNNLFILLLPFLLLGIGVILWRGELKSVGGEFFPYVLFSLGLAISGFIIKARNQKIKDQFRLISLGELVCGVIDNIEYALNGITLIISYEYEGRQFTQSTQHPVPFGRFKKGEVVSVLLDPSQPESCVVYQASVYR